MGTIVINQTDCKQNVVLQSSLDGITGGYYDAAGVWHEIGGADEYSEKAFILHLLSHYSTDNQSGYLDLEQSNSNRAIFGITLKGNAPDLTTAGKPLPILVFDEIPEDVTTLKIKNNGSVDYYYSFNTLSFDGSKWIRKTGTSFIQINGENALSIPSGAGTNYFIYVKAGSAGTDTIDLTDLNTKVTIEFS